MTCDELRDRMNELGLNIVDVALLCGVSRRTVEKWRSGSNPTPQLLWIVFEAMREKKLDLDWIAQLLRKDRSSK